ncbi:MAG TPA: hypothetical protein VGV89_06520 [Thermoplasmata archaeon]|nr:hypothetical protein [Thermoplasmata archaeon]
MADELCDVAASTGAGGIVVVGDVKHPIVGTPPPIARLVFDVFSTLLHERLKVRVILGNHDVGLARHLPREVDVEPVRGYRRGSLGLFHGHAWPSNEVLGASRIVTGHLHPGFRFAESSVSGPSKQRCWVRSPLPPAPVSGRRAGRIRARETIVLPAFNPLSGVESLNRNAPSRGRSFLVRRFLAEGEARAYLMDGTDLGPLPSWTNPRAPERSPPRR